MTAFFLVGLVCPVASYGTANSPPTITNPGNQSDAAGDVIFLGLAASEPDGPSLMFSASGLPSGLSLGAGNGRITGTPGFSAAGIHPVILTVSNGSLAADTQFTWKVLAVPSVPAIGSLGLMLLASGLAVAAARYRSTR